VTRCHPAFCYSKFNQIKQQITNGGFEMFTKNETTKEQQAVVYQAHDMIHAMIVGGHLEQGGIPVTLGYDPSFDSQVGVDLVQVKVPAELREQAINLLTPETSRREFICLN
jgi:hypothetical protein